MCRYADQFIAEGYNTIDAILLIGEVSGRATGEHYPFLFLDSFLWAKRLSLENNCVYSLAQAFLSSTLV